jgi:DNA-binding HxlR family transcriptional regulator
VDGVFDRMLSRTLHNLGAGGLVIRDVRVMDSAER